MIPAFVMKMLRFIPDRPYIMLQYYYHFHRLPRLNNPQTFNEKLQWLKLNDRKPIYTTMVDKVLAKDYVAKIIGDEHIIPTLGVWKNADDIDFESLPERFVLKTNHDSHGVVVCKNKAELDITKTREFLNKQLTKNGFWYGREWPYKNVERRILAEEYLDDNGDDLIDYKLMCFNGEVKCSFICSDRYNANGLHVTFFDKDWNLMPFERSHPARKDGFPKPSRYADMVKYAEAISKDMKFARIDFYEVDGEVYFGEITHYPGCGFEAFQPEEWDYRLGSWLKL